MNRYIYQYWKPKEWERKTWITSVPKREREREREREKLRANPSVQMGGSGASWVNPPQISTVLWSYSLPSALCSRCSHVCETKEKKVIIRFFLFWRETKVFYFNAAALSDFFFFFLIMLMCKTLELKQKVKCQECA